MAASANDAQSLPPTFDLHRHGHLDLMGRAWKLRDKITAYNAMYPCDPWLKGLKPE